MHGKFLEVTPRMSFLPADVAITLNRLGPGCMAPLRIQLRGVLILMSWQADLATCTLQL